MIPQVWLQIRSRSFQRSKALSGLYYSAIDSLMHVGPLCTYACLVGILDDATCIYIVLEEENLVTVDLL